MRWPPTQAPSWTGAATERALDHDPAGRPSGTVVVCVAPADNEGVPAVTAALQSKPTVMRALHLIDHFADIASHRSRDRLDQCFGALIEDLLGAITVTVLRPDDDAERAAPPPNRVQVQTRAHRTLVTMDSRGVDPFHIEILTRQTLTPEQRRVVEGIQRFHRHLRDLIDENERDSLTRLLNRKSFDETFMRMALQMEDGAGTEPVAPERRGAPSTTCWLGVIDIDHFKAVNDQHGHLIGDEVLILMAQLMRRNFRRQDCLYRFGGEEFVVLLRAPDADGASSAFERLRRMVEEFAFPQVGRLTISIGFTQVLDNDTSSAAFERADQAVYHAKHLGRNQVARYETAVADGDIAPKSQVSACEFF